MSDETEGRIKGFELECASIDPPDLAGGERRLAIIGIIVAGGLVAGLAPNVSNPTPVYIIAAGFYVMWHAILMLSWQIDKQMSKTLPRFVRFAAYIPAQASASIPEGRRDAVLRRQKKRG